MMIHVAKFSPIWHQKQKWYLKKWMNWVSSKLRAQKQKTKNFIASRRKMTSRMEATWKSPNCKQRELGHGRILTTCLGENKQTNKSYLDISQESIQMANQHRKRCWTMSFMRDMQIRPTRKHTHWDDIIKWSDKRSYLKAMWWAHHVHLGRQQQQILH